jgi:hypothetical protein
MSDVAPSGVVLKRTSGISATCAANSRAMCQKRCARCNSRKQDLNSGCYLDSTSAANGRVRLNP